MAHLSYPFGIQKEYNTTRYINNGRSEMDIISSEPSSVFKIAIRINDIHLIITPKNAIAKNDFRNWFDEYWNKDPFPAEALTRMDALINDPEKFDLVSGNTETGKLSAYKEFLYIRNNYIYSLNESTTNLPPRPSKYFPLLTEWHLQIWEMAKNAKQKSLDNSPESLIAFEILFIEKEIKYINNIYFPELTERAELPNTPEKVSNIAFKKWLNERKTKLEQPKLITVVDDYSFIFNECRNYINSISDFNVLRELYRDEGKSFEDFKRMSKEVNFDDIQKGFDEVFNIAIDIKKENENLSLYIEHVSIKEELKIFLRNCEIQSVLPNSDFLKWLYELRPYYMKHRTDRIAKLNKELENADGERKIKLELNKSNAIDMCNHYIAIIEMIIKHILDGVGKASSVKTGKDYKDEIWFKIGLSFAKGEVQELYSKYKNERGHFKKITLELGFKETDRPYISESLNNSTKKITDKNIFAAPFKVRAIQEYCKINDIKMIDSFKNLTHSE